MYPDLVVDADRWAIPDRHFEGGSHDTQIAGSAIVTRRRYERISSATPGHSVLEQI